MSCTRHFLVFEWEHHDWQRRVVWTDNQEASEADMWGRRISQENVLCRTQYVCRNCGKTREGAFCGCDKARGDQCPARLAHLDARSNAA